MKYIFITFLFVSTLFSNTNFLELTGRVVDTAYMLDESEESSLSKMLEIYENETSNQVVIVMIESLYGQDIADYGYQLGRHWGIGQKDKNNGVLIIVSLYDRKMRIEVGYGLEGTLTDKIAHEIVENKMKPSFRGEDYYGGLKKAIKSITEVSNGEYSSEKEQSLWPLIFIFLFPLWGVFQTTRSGIDGISGNSTSTGGFSSFSGGGGSFGGGGASGGW